MGGHAFKITRPATISEIYGKQGLDLLSLKPYGTNIPDGWGIIGSISKLTNLPTDYIINNTLGSVGKKPISGDIDLAIDKKFGTDWFSKIIPNFDFVNDRNTANGQLYTAVKIPGSNDYVQVDFMFGNNDLLKFTYHSPISSKYNGAIRTKFIMSLVSCLRYHYDYWCDYKNNDIVAYAGPSFTLDRGIIWGYKHHFSKNKNGYDFDKIKKTASRYNDSDKFLDVISKKYPSLNENDIIRGYIATESPQEICNIIFKNSTINDFDSFESIYENLLDSDYTVIFKQKVMEDLKQRAIDDGLQIEDKDLIICQ